MRISDWSSDVCSSDLPTSCQTAPPRIRPIIVPANFVFGNPEWGFISDSKRLLAPRHDRAPRETEHKQRDRVDAEHDPHRTMGSGCRHHAFRLVEIHDLDYPQVIEGANQGEHDAVDGEPQDRKSTRLTSSH